MDCLREKPCVACWRGDGRNAKLPGTAGRFGAGGEVTLLESEAVPSLFSSPSLSSGSWCSAGLCMQICLEQHDKEQAVKKHNKQTFSDR